MKRDLRGGYVHAQKLTPPTQALFPRSLAMIIFATLEVAIHGSISGTPMTHCGMEKAVEGAALAVNSTTLHGSVGSSLSPPLMILSCDCAKTKILVMKILHLKLLTFMYSNCEK